MVNATFFHCLSNVLQHHYDEARRRGISGHAPLISDMVAEELADVTLWNQTLPIYQGLRPTRYRLDRFFRVHPQHMFVFPQGTAYKQQLNVAFSAGEDESTWVARIGVGFYWAVGFIEAFSDYRHYQDRVRQNPAGFDRTFAAFGNYTEPPELRRLPLSDFVVNDNPQDVPDWRFFGRLLQYADGNDRLILENVGRFVQEVIRVFDWIERSGFGV